MNYIRRVLIIGEAFWSRNHKQFVKIHFAFKVASQKEFKWRHILKFLWSLILHLWTDKMNQISTDFLKNYNVMVILVFNQGQRINFDSWVLDLEWIFLFWILNEAILSFNARWRIMGSMIYIWSLNNWSTIFKWWTVLFQCTASVWSDSVLHLY